MKLIGERKAIASAVMVLYAFFYLFLALAELQPGWGRAHFAMAAIYGTGFFALVAGYFWARWFAMGVGISGIITGGFALWQIGPEPIVLFIGGTHLLATLSLTGTAMKAPFEGQSQWRTRLHMDDNAVTRLGNSVTRASVSLPYILLYALAPKPASMFATSSACTFTTLTMTALAATVLGLYGVVKMRTWGLAAIGGAAMLMIANAATASSCTLVSGSIVGAGLLLAAVAPFAQPLWTRVRNNV
jgi:hypothetical protein